MKKVLTINVTRFADKTQVKEDCLVKMVCSSITPAKKDGVHTVRFENDTQMVNIFYHANYDAVLPHSNTILSDMLESLERSEVGSERNLYDLEGQEFELFIKVREWEQNGAIKNDAQIVQGFKPDSDWDSKKFRYESIKKMFNA